MSLFRMFLSIHTIYAFHGRLSSHPKALKLVKNLDGTMVTLRVVYRVKSCFVNVVLWVALVDFFKFALRKTRQCQKKHNDAYLFGTSRQQTQNSRYTNFIFHYFVKESFDFLNYFIRIVGHSLLFQLN